MNSQGRNIKQYDFAARQYIYMIRIKRKGGGGDEKERNKTFIIQSVTKPCLVKGRGKMNQREFTSEPQTRVSIKACEERSTFVALV